MDKQWFIVSSRGNSSIIYLISADSAEVVCEKLSVLFSVHDIKPLRWGELHNLLGISMPLGKRVADRVIGNFTISNKGQVVCIWPL